MTVFAKLTIAACALAISGGAAQAREPASAPAATAMSSPDASAEPSMAQRYCVKSAITGSRIDTKVCKTRRQWIAQEGWDPARQK